MHEIGYSHISTTLIPCIQTLLLDGNTDVRTAACDALVTAADVLREADIGTVVLTCVLNLAHDERDEQRTTAVQLMHALAPMFGYDLCKSFVALELAAFADDSMLKVRKSTAQCFPELDTRVLTDAGFLFPGGDRGATAAPRCRAVRLLRPGRSGHRLPARPARLRAGPSTLGRLHTDRFTPTVGRDQRCLLQRRLGRRPHQPPAPRRSTRCTCSPSTLPSLL